MDILYTSMIQRNKFFLIVLVLFSLLSIFMPHGSGEAHEHNEYESLFKLFTNNYKPVSNTKKLFEKISAIVLKVFALFQVKSSAAVLTNSRLALFNILFSNKINFYLFAILCLYFHGGKFKNSKHSDLLPLMEA